MPALPRPLADMKTVVGLASTLVAALFSVVYPLIFPKDVKP